MQAMSPTEVALVDMGNAALILVWVGAALPTGTPTRDDVVDHLRVRAKSWSSDQVEVLAEILHERADAYDLDPELVLAVMAVESSFRFRARSPVGAMGLLQVMPSTGRLYARRSGVRWRGSKTLYDPIANIRIGTRYLAWLIRKFDGNLPLALTSYCHGIGRVKRTLRSQGKLSHRRLRYSRRVLRQLRRLRRARARRGARWTETTRAVWTPSNSSDGLLGMHLRHSAVHARPHPHMVP